MNYEHMTSIGATIGGGFFAGLLIGYAVKKVVKLVAVVVGLFFAGLTYLQYEQIVSISWNKIPRLSQNLAITLAILLCSVSCNVMP